jgi:hypothetical protein
MSLLRLLASDRKLAQSGDLPAWAALLAERNTKWSEKEGLVGMLPAAIKGALSKVRAWAVL